MTGTRKLQFASFAAVAFGIVLIWRAILQGRMLADHPLIASWGPALDIFVFIPLLYYVLVIRRGGRAIALVPVFIACGAIAEALLPAGNPLLRFASVALIPLEIGLLLYVAGKVRTAARETSGSDPVTRIAEMIRAIVPVPLVADVVASEISVFYLALFSWRRPISGRNADEFTSHEQSGWGTVLSGLLVAIAAESIGIHLWLYSTAPGLAWGLAALDFYGVLWLIADYRAMNLRTHALSPDGLRLRLGFRWEAELPIQAVESIEAIGPGARWDAKLAIGGDPNFLITLKAPVVLRGIYGFRKTARVIGILIDDGERFRAQAALAGVWKAVTPAVAPRKIETIEPVPVRGTLSRQTWLSRRPDYIPLEDWLKHPPPELER